MPARTSLLTALAPLALAAAALATPAPATAADFVLSNGGFTVTVPDGWPRIMQSPGDPETLVFQAPGPSASSREALARVMVTSQHVRDLASFGQFVLEATNHDKALPGFKLDQRRSDATTWHYTATEGKVVQAYADYFFLRRGYAIQVRCVRPLSDSASAQWSARFDAGCTGVADSLRRDAR